MTDGTVAMAPSGSSVFPDSRVQGYLQRNDQSSGGKGNDGYKRHGVSEAIPRIRMLSSPSICERVYVVMWGQRFLSLSDTTGWTQLLSASSRVAIGHRSMYDRSLHALHSYTGSMRPTTVKMCSAHAP